MEYKSWMCLICGWMYNEEAGLPEEGIAAASASPVAGPVGGGSTIGSAAPASDASSSAQQALKTRDQLEPAPLSGTGSTLQLIRTVLWGCAGCRGNQQDFRTGRALLGSR